MSEGIDRARSINGMGLVGRTRLVDRVRRERSGTGRIHPLGGHDVVARRVTMRLLRVPRSQIRGPHPASQINCQFRCLRSVAEHRVYWCCEAIQRRKIEIKGNKPCC